MARDSKWPCSVSSVRTGIAMRPDVATQDPLNDFQSEVTFVYTDPIPAPAAWPTTLAPTHAIDTTSRVISFVLGFALASLIAWLGSISGDGVAATGNSAPVAAVGTSVVASAIEEKTPAIKRESDVPAPMPVAAISARSAPAPATPTRAATPLPPAATSAEAAATRTAEAVAPSSRTARTSLGGYRGGLALTSSPAGAQVVLNGKVVGETPVVLNDLPVGSRAVVVRRDGYSPWSASVRVIANQRTTVRATLTPQSGS
jgi:hypothetical protein